MKVTVVGAGMVGSTTALRLLEDGLASRLVLVDVIEGLAKAVALDLAQSAPLRGHGTDIVGGSDYGPTQGSDLVVITAGLPRKPGQSRADLLATNAEIVRGVVQEVAVRSCQPLRPGQQLRLGAVDGTIALDGERHIMINSADEITVELVHAGPRVVDFRGLLYAAASAGLFVVDRNGRDSRSPVPAIS